MAKIKFFGGAARTWIPNLFRNDGPEDIVKQNAKTLIFTNTEGDRVTLKGSGFKTEGGKAKKGTIDSIKITDENGVIVKYTDVNTKFKSVYNPLFSDDPAGFFDAHYAIIRNSDKVIGSSQDDFLEVGYEGGDTYYGRGGNDYLNAFKGSEFYDGGPGDQDELSYLLSALTGDGKRGAKIDAKKGIAKDPWGDKDTFKNVERFTGSSLDDVIKGSGKDETLRGLKGNDVLDGRGGFDLVVYQGDENIQDFVGNQVGAPAGVTVNLATGKATDGWGNTDTLKNIEGAVGSDLADTLIGDAKDNVLKGERGNDTMTGNAGGDIFVFNPAPDNATNHDTITDFNRAEGDKIALAKNIGFGGLTSEGSLNASEFIANATGAPTTAAQHIVYNTANGNLYLDPGGNASSGDQILIATLTGAPTLLASDFEIWH